MSTHAPDYESPTPSPWHYSASLKPVLASSLEPHIRGSCESGLEPNSRGLAGGLAQGASLSVAVARQAEERERVRKSAHANVLTSWRQSAPGMTSFKSPDFLNSTEQDSTLLLCPPDGVPQTDYLLIANDGSRISSTLLLGGLHRLHSRAGRTRVPFNGCRQADESSGIVRVREMMRIVVIRKRSEVLH